MNVAFQNSYSSTVWVCVSWYDPSSCGADAWATAGWWRVDPGETVWTDVWTDNRYWYFYAEAEDGAYWAGPYGPLVATWAAFQSCIGVAPNGHANLEVGMRQVDAGWWYWAYLTYYVNLT